jgi:dephospho-CoA kinase
MSREKKSDLVIGLTGLIGAGKGEVARYFTKKGFHYYSHSDELREMLREKGQETSRDNLFQLGNRLRAEYGPGYITQRIRAKMQRPAVVDSIRNPGEVEELRREKNFVLLAVEAPIEIRYQRVMTRTREGEEKLTLEAFREKEERELQGSATNQQLLKVAGLADYAVKNDSTLESLRKKLDRLSEKLN